MTPRLLAAAINKAGSVDTVKVARALEDLSFDSVVGPVRMRAEDHQLLLPQVVNTIVPVDGKTVKVGGGGRYELWFSHRCGLHRQRTGTEHRLQDGPALKAF